MATVSTRPHITHETSVDQSFMDTTIMHRYLQYVFQAIEIKIYSTHVCISSQCVICWYIVLYTYVYETKLSGV